MSGPERLEKNLARRKNYKSPLSGGGGSKKAVLWTDISDSMNKGILMCDNLEYTGNCKHISEQ